MSLSVSKLQAGEVYTIEFEDRHNSAMCYKCESVYLGTFQSEFSDKHYCFAVSRNHPHYLEVDHLLFRIDEDDKFESFDIVDREYTEVAREYFNSNKYDLFWVLEEQIKVIENSFTSLINQIQNELI